MPQMLFIVSPSDPATFRSLTSVLAGDSDADVIYDRRFQEADRSQWVEDQLRPRNDRRRRAEIDEEIRVKGWACVRLQPEPPASAPALRRRRIPLPD
jgi:hypothetical protein